MLPVPYGLLAHELIEVVDCERILPGLTRISKLAEDFPFIDHHSIMKERGFFTNFHQNVFVYCDPDSTVGQILDILPSSKTNLISTFKTYNDIRYSFINNLFTQYNMGEENDEEFYNHLKRISSSNLWNIYKQLTQEFMQKTAQMPFKQIEMNFKSKVLEPLKKVIMSIHLQSVEHENNDFDGSPAFRLVYNKKHNDSTDLDEEEKLIDMHKSGTRFMDEESER